MLLELETTKFVPVCYSSDSKTSEGEMNEKLVKFNVAWNFVKLVIPI